MPMQTRAKQGLSTTVLVTDRAKYIAAFQTLVDGRVWGVGNATKAADRRLSDVLDKRPDLSRETLILIDVTKRQLASHLEKLREIYPRVAIVVSDRAADAKAHNDVMVVNLRQMMEKALQRTWDLAQVRERVESLLTLLEPARNVLLLTHPNPDPDAIASALALRTVLGRNRQTATIGYLGRPLSRPENLTMIDLLGIDLERIDETELPKYDAIVLVDCQENLFSSFALPEVAAVIDHHPEKPQYTAAYRDVIPEEGSTSTIMTRYLQALQIEPSQRLATALLYGVKSDTFFLNREVNADDIDSFTYLYPRANINRLRRIEVPEIEMENMRRLGQALVKAECRDEIFLGGFDHDATSEDLVARLADYGLQIKHAQWSLCYAPIGETLIVSVRNVGFVRSAGAAVNAAFSKFGAGGGHRSAARAILDLDKVKAELGDDWEKQLPDFLLNRLRQAITPAEEDG